MTRDVSVEFAAIRHWTATRLVAMGRRVRAVGTAVVAALAVSVVSLGGAAQVAGVAVGAWAVWGVDDTAGKLALAGGLLFLGGAVGRVVREVRDGSAR